MTKVIGRNSYQNKMGNSSYLRIKSERSINVCECSCVKMQLFLNCMINDVNNYVLSYVNFHSANKEADKV